MKSIYRILENFAYRKLGISRFFISTFFLIFHFDHSQDFGFGTIIDGAKGGSITAKAFTWVKLVWVNSI